MPFNREMATCLSQIARVQMGLSFRWRVEPERDGNVAVIQMRDLAEGHRLGDARNLVTVNMEGVNPRHFVKRNDLVFRSRGKTTTAAIIESEVKPAIVVAPLLRIRVTNAQVLPEYLCWFINQPSSQAFLHSRATGTAMVMIGKSVLNALEITLPDLDTQKQIAAFAALSEQEQRLMKDLAKAKKRVTEGVLMRLAKQSVTPFTLPEHRA